jgi:hypothetical protein
MIMQESSRFTFNRISVLAGNYGLPADVVREIACSIGIKVVSNFSPLTHEEVALLRPH